MAEMIKIFFGCLGIGLMLAAVFYYFNISVKALMKQYKANSAREGIVFQEDLDAILAEQKRTGIPLPKKSQCKIA